MFVVWRTTQIEYCLTTKIDTAHTFNRMFDALASNVTLFSFHSKFEIRFQIDFFLLFLFRLKKESKLIDALKSASEERHRVLCQSLLILLVNAQNIINRLKEVNANATNDFNWLSQMRFYFVDGKIEIHQLHSVVSYGCEYVGNRPRLVVTPQTDRCHRSIFCALQQKFAVALTV